MVTETSFADRDGAIWMNGEMIEWRDAKVHVLTHTLHYGVGVFEGVRAYDTSSGPCIFRLQDHTRRLFDSAQILRLDIPFSESELNAAQKEVFALNNLNEGYLRPVAYLGSEAMGLRADGLTVNVAIACWPWPDYMDPQSRELGITVRTSSYTRHHVNITMCKAKANGNYINSIMALREAIDSGCDEALLLDNEGYVAEGSGENFFLVKNGVIHTPELTSCLPGITRDTVLVFARELNIPVIERRITRDEVYIADEAFFTGTAAEVLPIRELDGRTIGDGKPGSVTLRLQALYFDQVRGKRDAHPDWHALVTDPV
ncbi:MAG: branched-chain amino acid transaminase [Pseudomonadota bacterium]|uniref:branched-chain-amino-acid transaminase n=1 Tax=marine metagenome TaxID=408172 RepID=A0A381PLX2_9ZZZZ|nr:branched-chain amino acid transaminase [Pseudomonadota bacterium]HBP14582.1 branched chain amino acid aminotransferase [Gammaproteobacteria bacterium]HCP48803.1 branched chain amino acid aminotransferase [Gammaproteobacteria bacterium]|tara:strand:- start:13825 stop:14769 length:945 start_codon:yes stop_codon:yes gene_type:complete